MYSQINRLHTPTLKISVGVLLFLIGWEVGIKGVVVEIVSIPPGFYRPIRTEEAVFLSALLTVIFSFLHWRVGGRQDVPRLCSRETALLLAGHVACTTIWLMIAFAIAHFSFRAWEGNVAGMGNQVSREYGPGLSRSLPYAIGGGAGFLVIFVFLCWSIVVSVYSKYMLFWVKRFHTITGSTPEEEGATLSFDVRFEATGAVLILLGLDTIPATLQAGTINSVSSRVLGSPLLSLSGWVFLIVLFAFNKGVKRKGLPVMLLYLAVVLFALGVFLAIR